LAGRRVSFARDDDNQIGKGLEGKACQVFRKVLKEMKMKTATHKQVLREYLGDIDAELLLQNLTNTNPHVSLVLNRQNDDARSSGKGIIDSLATANLTVEHSIDAIRFGLTELRKRGGGRLTVSAEFEYEWDGDPKTTLPVAKKFIRLTVEADE
jgi:hypothetical protein